MGQVVWTSDQKRSAFSEYAELAAAVKFHYARVLFGAQYGMK